MAGAYRGLRPPPPPPSPEMVSRRARPILALKPPETMPEEKRDMEEELDFWNVQSD